MRCVNELERTIWQFAIVKNKLTDVWKTDVNLLNREILSNILSVKLVTAIDNNRFQSMNQSLSITIGNQQLTTFFLFIGFLSMAIANRINLRLISIIVIWLCLTRTANHQIHEFDWLKSTLKAVLIFPSTPTSRPVIFCSEKVTN